eukprot:TRINITY_DN13931_c0_g2_i1.p1 TRINITY_DN13931_c0_g2~~TRINITY_DN13931_c0_g2_i1.p1  ORF type:complete len:259 (+),score=45.80 TRINITY_DN13931_c0_g2_i1:106-777(+)
MGDEQPVWGKAEAPTEDEDAEGVDELAAVLKRTADANACSAQLAVLLCRLLGSARRRRRRRRGDSASPRCPAAPRVPLPLLPHRAILTPAEEGGAVSREAAELGVLFARRLAAAGLCLEDSAEAEGVARRLLSAASEVLSRRPTAAAAVLIAQLRQAEAAASRRSAAPPVPPPPQDLRHAHFSSECGWSPRRGRAATPHGRGRCRSQSPWSTDSTYGAGRMSP